LILKVIVSFELASIISKDLLQYLSTYFKSTVLVCKLSPTSLCLFLLILPLNLSLSHLLSPRLLPFSLLTFLSSLFRPLSHYLLFHLSYLFLFLVCGALIYVGLSFFILF